MCVCERACACPCPCTMQGTFVYAHTIQGPFAYARTIQPSKKRKCSNKERTIRCLQRETDPTTCVHTVEVKRVLTHYYQGDGNQRQTPPYNTNVIISQKLARYNTNIIIHQQLKRQRCDGVGASPRYGGAARALPLATLWWCVTSQTMARSSAAAVRLGLPVRAAA